MTLDARAVMFQAAAPCQDVITGAILYSTTDKICHSIDADTDVAVRAATRAISDAIDGAIDGAHVKDLTI